MKERREFNTDVERQSFIKGMQEKIFRGCSGFRSWAYTLDYVDGKYIIEYNTIVRVA